MEDALLPWSRFVEEAILTIRMSSPNVGGTLCRGSMGRRGQVMQVDVSVSLGELDEMQCTVEELEAAVRASLEGGLECDDQVEPSTLYLASVVVNVRLI
jgi:hypothetical protein